MSGQIRAMTMGAVANFYCEDGAVVDEGDQVLALESMKMLIEHRAPVAGCVSFQVELGQTVAKGELLAEIEDRS